MTIRRVLFILFLYVLLVWLVAAYLYSSDARRLVDRGLLWTAGGVAAILLWLILERVIGWWRARRAQTAGTPITQVVSSKTMHEEDAALVGLLHEADQRLAEAKRASGARPPRTSDLPLYLILGPEGAGKTAVFHNCGIEPSLLAGQVVGGGEAITSTRVANLWLAQQSLFIEVSGRVFNSEPNRLAEFLSLLQPGARTTGWRSWLRLFRQPISLRGVLMFFDSREFAGTPEPSALDRSAQQIRERLTAIARVFGVEVPVYVFFTKTDGLRYFADFFSRLGEAEAGQVFGVLSAESAQIQNRDKVWAEAETKRLNREFQALFLRLSDRRLLALTQETESGRKPAIYEFPREFKRIRTPLVQFLVDVFKPDRLRAGPRLRGFFFTGIRKTKRAAGVTDTPSVFRSSGAGPEATQIFAPEMLASMRDPMSVFRKETARSGSGPLVDRWMFVTEFFNKVLSLDRPAIERVTAPAKFEQHRTIAIGAAASLVFFFGLVWTVSWIGNWRLGANVQTAIAAVRQGSGDLSVVNLQALDRLRGQTEQLQKDDSVSLHWGLYTGDALQEVARKTYFERLKGLSLNGINQTLASRLQQAGTAGQAEGTGSTYERLKTHRTITALSCPVDRPLISKVLKATALEAHPGLGNEQLVLLYTQLEFYAAQLGKNGKLPVRLSEDSFAEEKARTYLRQASGLDQQLQILLSDLGQQIKPLAVADYADDYRSVLTGPAEFPGVFTKKGQIVFEDLVAKGNFASAGEACVMGESANLARRSMDLETRDRLKSLYYRRYADAWRDFLASYSVIRYSGPEDAARRLSILGGPRSPLLGIVKMVAVNTNFPPAKPGELSWWEKGAERVGLSSIVQAQAKAEKATGRLQQLLASNAPLMTTADLARLFQPVLFTTPAESDRLVNDNNGEYVKGLRALQQSLDGLARASVSEKKTVIPQAQVALTQARASHAGLADKFSDVGNEGLTKQLSNLLEQPIRLAASVIPSNSETFSGAKTNGELAQFCRAMSAILTKYPFTSLSQSDAALVDIAKGFAPTEGLVWKYVQQSGSDLVVRRGTQWESNPALQGLKVAPELLGFLNRAQQLTDVFFAEGGMMQPKLKYVLRPVPGQTIRILLTLDGTELSSQNPLQKTFFWPAPPGALPGANGTVEVSGFTTGFGRFDGLWGVFRLFQNSDERPYGTRVVQWSEIRGRGGAAAQTLSPPAKVEFVEFPGGADLFNPKFFEALQCPKRAVVVN